MQKKGVKKEEKRKVKRGLSTIVITLIIILVSLVAIGIIWVVVRNMIQTGSEQISMSQFNLKAEIMEVKLNNVSNNINLTVKRNPGEGKFTSLKFIFYDGQDYEVITQTVSLNELEEKKFNFRLNNLSVSRLVSISMVPVLNQQGKESIGEVLYKYKIREETSPVGADLWGGLTLWLRCDDDLLDNRSIDSSYYNRSVTCSGGYCPIYLPTGGVDGSGAYDFDGINNYTMTISTPLSNPPVWTYATWFYPRSNGTSISALIGQGSNPTVRWGGAYTRLYLYLAWSESPGYKQIGSGNLALNQWHHAVGIVNLSDSTNQTMYLYIDGVRVASSFWINGTITRPSGNHYINIRDSARTFNGILDSIRVYNRSLSLSEIQDLNSSKI